MINPLLCIKERERYKICVGNNRYLAALELNYKEMPVKVVTSEVPQDLKSAIEDYIPTEVEGYPSRRRKNGI